MKLIIWITGRCWCHYRSRRNQDPYGCYCVCNDEYDIRCDHYRGEDDSIVF